MLMFDAEVTRLRRLRNTALRVRAIADNLNSKTARANPMLSRSAAGCWRIARAITGRLRAHPHLGYQRGPSLVRGAYNYFGAAFVAGIARMGGRPLHCCSAQLRLLTRELDDARALTWSADFSDSLGRFQLQIRRLIEETEAASQREAGTIGVAARAETRDCTGQPRAEGAPNWPYLAF
jgi:hypothetical protein